MAKHVVIQLEAIGQVLNVVEAPIIASAIADYLRFEVAYSSEWAAFEKWIAIRHDEVTATAALEDGKAQVPIDVVAQGGVLEVALVGREGARQFTTAAVYIDLAHSGKERG